MKTRLILVAALLLFCVPARADSTTVIDVVGQTCEICIDGESNLPVHTLNAQFTVVLATGTFGGPFWSPGEQGYIPGQQFEVTGVSGTFDGEAISLAPPFTTGVPWIQSTGAQPFEPFHFGNVCFTTSGNTHCLENDLNIYDLLDGGIPMTWSTFALASGPATAPEPASFALVVFGILAIAARGKGWRSRSGFLLPSEKSI